MYKIYISDTIFEYFSCLYQICNESNLAFFNPKYLKNGESYQESATNKRDRKFNFLSNMYYQI